MIKIVVKGYASEPTNQSLVGPEIIRKEINWLTIPRLGETIAVGGESAISWEKVEEVVHFFEEGTIEVHFRADSAFLRICVEADGFDIEE